MGRGTDSEIPLGYIAGVHGVRGWVRVHSYTEPREQVVAYRRWILRRNGERSDAEVTTGQAHGKSVIAKLAGVDDRDAAADLIGAEILMPRSGLPECGPREYYWADLAGMQVLDQAGNLLGEVDHLIETGAHDVLVLTGSPQRLIPFVLDSIVTDVDLEHRTITVTWDAGYWNE